MQMRILSTEIDKRNYQLSFEGDGITGRVFSKFQTAAERLNEINISHSALRLIIITK